MGSPAIIKAAYAASVGVFLWLIAAFYVPGQGFTAFVMLGDKVSSRYLPELRALDPYVEYDSYGYDAQHYAQIAMHPQLRDPQLAGAVDNLSYRARRILFCWTAYILGLGQPAWVLQAFSLQNVACWLILAFVLLRWFPADTWNNYLRWAGLLFSFGLCFSVRGALVDGPSLLMLALGMACVESRRGWLGAAILGAAGLGKETNILSATVFADPNERDGRRWLGVIARGALVGLPLLVWMCLLWAWFRGTGDAGQRNFAVPLAGYIEKWQATLSELRQQGWNSVVGSSALVLVSLTTQFLFFAVRLRWRDLWWRMGAAYAVLMLVLGTAVWEGYPGASSRVLLPMAFAFNVSVPRGRWWTLALLLGNLTFFSAFDRFNPPGHVSYELVAPSSLQVSPTGRVEVTFNDSWYPPERSRWQYWRWASGTAVVTVHNPHRETVLADVRLELKSNSTRTLTVRQGGKEFWRGQIGNDLKALELRALRLPPGDTAWVFETDKATEAQRLTDPRLLAFSLRNLRITLTGFDR